ncbi:MAG TPA: ABC transporter permease [Lachnospiraceae bacterium]|nr:ABC transporter permease [Lachnospiraceae bacterium]
MKPEKKSFIENPGVQSVLASLICILIGLVIGYIVLLLINPAGAGRALLSILKNFLYFPRPQVALEYFGSTLVKTAPLLMCTLSVLFAYKVGLFNIGAAGQYAVGAGLALYFAIGFKMPWFVCLIVAMIGAGIVGGFIGFLKAYLNVNEVIAGIMLNWISLYSVNMLLTGVKESSTTYTLALRTNAPGGLLPSAGLQNLFSGNKYVTIAIPLAILTAVIVWVVMDKTALGYELKATGLNIHAAKYAGMKEKQNMILTMVISGAIAGLGAAFLYLSGIEQWSCAQTSVPAMGFNGIAAAFLGGLHPIGCIFSAFFIQHITSGGSYVDKMVYSSQISDLISAIIIYSCGFVLFFKHSMRKGIAKAKKGGSKS